MEADESMSNSDSSDTNVSTPKHKKRKTISDYVSPTKFHTPITNWHILINKKKSVRKKSTPTRNTVSKGKKSSLKTAAIHPNIMLANQARNDLFNNLDEYENDDSDCIISSMKCKDIDIPKCVEIPKSVEVPKSDFEEATQDDSYMPVRFEPPLFRPAKTFEYELENIDPTDKRYYFYSEDYPQEKQEIEKALLSRAAEYRRCMELGLPSPFSTPQKPQEPFVPIPRDDLMKGIVVLVDIRQNGKSVSSCYGAHLEAMGAVVEKSFTKDVAVVLFSNGLYSVYQKATARKIPVVGVKWIEESKAANCVLPMKDFPATCKETYDNPNVRKLYQRRRDWSPTHQAKLQKQREQRKRRKEDKLHEEKMRKWDEQIKELQRQKDEYTSDTEPEPDATELRKLNDDLILNSSFTRRSRLWMEKQKQDIAEETTFSDFLDFIGDTDGDERDKAQTAQYNKMKEVYDEQKKEYQERKLERDKRRKARRKARRLARSLARAKANEIEDDSSDDDSSYVPASLKKTRKKKTLTTRRARKQAMPNSSSETSTSCTRVSSESSTLEVIATRRTRKPRLSSTPVTRKSNAKSTPKTYDTQSHQKITSKRTKKLSTSRYTKKSFLQSSSSLSSEIDDENKEEQMVCTSDVANIDTYGLKTLSVKRKQRESRYLLSTPSTSGIRRSLRMITKNQQKESPKEPASKKSRKGDTDECEAGQFVDDPKVCSKDYNKKNKNLWSDIEPIPATNEAKSTDKTDDEVNCVEGEPMETDDKYYYELELPDDYLAFDSYSRSLCHGDSPLPIDENTEECSNNHEDKQDLSNCDVSSGFVPKNDDKPITQHDLSPDLPATNSSLDFQNNTENDEKPNTENNVLNPDLLTSKLSVEFMKKSIKNEDKSNIDNLINLNSSTTNLAGDFLVQMNLVDGKSNAEPDINTSPMDSVMSLDLLPQVDPDNGKSNAEPDINTSPMDSVMSLDLLPQVDPDNGKSNAEPDVNTSPMDSVMSLDLLPQVDPDNGKSNAEPDINTSPMDSVMSLDLLPQVDSDDGKSSTEYDLSSNLCANNLSGDFLAQMNPGVEHDSNPGTMASGLLGLQTQNLEIDGKTDVICPDSAASCMSSYSCGQDKSTYSKAKAGSSNDGKNGSSSDFTVCHASRTLVKPKKSCFTKYIISTSMDPWQKSLLKKAITKLGNFTLTETMHDKVTHVVCGDPKRTLNVFHGLVNGSWILKFSWVLSSLKAREWQLEDQHLAENFKPAMMKMVESYSSDSFSNQLFYGCGRIYVTSRAIPAQHEMHKLLSKAGASLTFHPSHAKIIVGQKPEYKKLNPKMPDHVNEKWVLDSIAAFELKPLKDFYYC